MKSRFIYPIALLALLAIFVICGNIFFRYSPVEYKEQVEEDIRYTYLSRYVELSDYDDDFRKAASVIGYDWTLIAAIAYTESRFDSTAVSEAGACGVMQVMPNTLRGFDIPDSMHMNPQVNIMAATELLRALDKRFRYIRNPKERINFVLASYNAGYGHIQDAMQLAKKHGKNRFVWNNSVDSFLICKSMPEYYTDSVCRNGQFNGWRETLSFVKKVNRNWKRFERMQQEYTDSINIVVTNDSTKRIAQ
jgi:membrane-bound lytic murein transglycosylase F